MPLASAAAAAGTRSARPIALAGPDPASSATASPGERLSDAQRGEPAAQRVEDVLARDRAYLGGNVGEVRTDDVQAASSCAAARCSVSIVMS